MAERKMTCDKCRKAVPIPDIKYVVKGNGKAALCSECRAKGKEAGKKTKEKVPEKKPYFCVRCRYKFKWRASGDTLLKCPYCGKPDKLIEDIAPDADKLLREIDLE